VRLSSAYAHARLRRTVRCSRSAIISARVKTGIAGDLAFSCDDSSAARNEPSSSRTAAVAPRRRTRAPLCHPFQLVFISFLVSALRFSDKRGRHSHSGRYPVAQDRRQRFKLLLVENSSRLLQNAFVALGHPHQMIVDIVLGSPKGRVPVAVNTTG
jgi:hypothetical protein